MRGGGSWGHRKHRKGGHGKNASPPNAAGKSVVLRDAHRSEHDRDIIRLAKRELQGFIPAEEWLKRNEH